MRLAGLLVSCALVACSGKPSVDAGDALRRLACPDGGCVSVTCPSPATVPNNPSECPGNGKSWLKDDVTGACCEYDCWGFWGEGFTRFNSQAECEATPECNGTPVGGVLPAGDGCNTCTCVSASQWECTEQNCSGGPVGKACGYWQGGCPASQYCAFVPADMCSDGDMPSVCLDRPASCTREVAPVCACNGREYTNRCEAAREGSGIRALGACRRYTACASTADCAADEYCPPWGGARRCVKRPLGCVNEFSPVCGKDELAYGNPCLAAMAGVDVRKAGACTGSCSSKDECAPDEYCSACSAGQCLPRGNSQRTCATHEPVCGCDGQSYACPELTHVNGTSVAHAGQCP